MIRDFEFHFTNAFLLHDSHVPWFIILSSFLKILTAFYFHGFTNYRNYYHGLFPSLDGFKITAVGQVSFFFNCSKHKIVNSARNSFVQVTTFSLPYPCGTQ